MQLTRLKKGCKCANANQLRNQKYCINSTNANCAIKKNLHMRKCKLRNQKKLHEKAIANYENYKKLLKRNSI